MTEDKNTQPFTWPCISFAQHTSLCLLACRSLRLLPDGDGVVANLTKPDRDSADKQANQTHSGCISVFQGWALWCICWKAFPRCFLQADAALVTEWELDFSPWTLGFRRPAQRPAVPPTSRPQPLWTEACDHSPDSFPAVMWPRLPLHDLRAKTHGCQFFLTWSRASTLLPISRQVPPSPVHLLFLWLFFLSSFQVCVLNFGH